MALSLHECVDLIHHREAGLFCSAENYCNFRPTAFSPQSRGHYVFKVVLFLVFVLVSTATASASCGNYLYRNGKPVSDTNSSSGRHNAMQSHKVEATNDPAAPCHGPNCSKDRAPLTPVPFALANMVNGFDQAAILEALAQMPSPVRGIEIPESERGAYFVPSSIFRPPTV